MRQKSVSSNRHAWYPRSILGLGLGLGLGLFGFDSAFATPVYLHPESRFPSEHFNREWLESRTEKVQFQRWFRVRTKDKVYGWVPEDHVVTALKLSTEALVLNDVPYRGQPERDALRQQAPTLLRRGSRVTVIENRGSWVRVRDSLRISAPETWVPSEELRAVAPPDGKQKVYVFGSATTYVLPGAHARVHGHLEGGTFLAALSSTAMWFEVRHRYATAYIRRSEVATAKSLGETMAYPLFAHTPLRSAPLPHADLVRMLSSASHLTIVGAKIQRWGQVRAPKIGMVWWPITDSAEEGPGQSGPLLERLPTASLFTRRIFDMAASASIPSLKFVSAQGIYRTLDGMEWSRIPLFKNENHPIAVTSGGPIFIGPYVSDDHGETFQQWIRWDSLVATIKKKHKVGSRQIQILDIKPEDEVGRRVVVTLNIGLTASVRVVTDDQGMSWQAF